MISWIVFDLGGVVIDVDFNEFFLTLPLEVQAKARLHAGAILALFREYEESAGVRPAQSVYDGIRVLLEYPLTDQQIATAVNSVLGKQNEDVSRLIFELSRRYQVACLSNTNHIHWEVLLTRYSVMNSFSIKMASHLLGCSKPDRRIYEIASGMIGAPPEEILFFDDKAENVMAATLAGWNARIFTDFSRFMEDLKELHVWQKT